MVEINTSFYQISNSPNAKQKGNVASLIKASKRKSLRELDLPKAIELQLTDSFMQSLSMENEQRG